MKSDLEPAKQVVVNLLEEIREMKRMQSQVSFPQMAEAFSISDQMPLFDSGKEIAVDPKWKNEEAYYWLYAEVWHFRGLMHRPKPNPVPESFHELALPVYEQWRQEKKEVFNLQCKIIPPPTEDIFLIDYLQQLAETVTENNEKRHVWLESLYCFLQFLREDKSFQELGAVEALFPYKMEIRKGKNFKKIDGKVKEIEVSNILRRVDKTVWPIDILAASEIIQNLVTVFLNGRIDLRYSVAEVLGFTWLCLSIGRYGITLSREMVLEVPVAALKHSEKSKAFFRPEYFIEIKTSFGPVDVPISKILYEFLLSLPRPSHYYLIFQKDLRVLERTFQNKVVKFSKRAKKLGVISFKTFMSPPHEAIGHRSFLKKRKKFSRKKVSSTDPAK